MATEVRHIQETYGIVGRETEIRRALACLRAGRHLLLEGPVGVGKTVLATALARRLDRDIFRVDGDERYTEQKLTGWFDPPLVLRVGYKPEAFVPGPLVQAMKDAGILFVNELNRMPEAVQNVLLPALDEGLVSVPMLGQISCPEQGFLVVATQNPREFVGTGHLSEALRDRFELVRLDYQSEQEEGAIVVVNTGETIAEIVQQAVAIGRATRNHPAIKRGASVRAAIAMVQIARRLPPAYTLLEPALIALPTRIELKEEAERELEDVIRELVEAAAKKVPGGSPRTT
ncbi:MAG: MoxR family ATPase [Chloroflexi bacterium]|nr:MoxR family ATPase [Chloroflexota bacterium]